MLNMVLSAYLQDTNTRLADEILARLYVDNVLMSANSVEEAVQKYKKSKSLFAAIGMNLRAFISNSQEANAQMNTTGHHMDL